MLPPSSGVWWGWLGHTDLLPGWNSLSQLKQHAMKMYAELYRYCSTNGWVASLSIGPPYPRHAQTAEEAEWAPQPQLLGPSVLSWASRRRWAGRAAASTYISEWRRHLLMSWLGQVAVVIRMRHFGHGPFSSLRLTLRNLTCPSSSARIWKVRNWRSDKPRSSSKIPLKWAQIL
jgi:hypothetical protein